ncbi:unnamed protein product [Rodentolepis nana]|uniref:Heterogeneous nuclear ribonucleoprotein A/B n=1 Tax=Rodentolepis nana TaxID=102285 RepID=A0A0R3TS95_RODNA|nr:unnamed protein product [Rodentolepis nana]
MEPPVENADQQANKVEDNVENIESEEMVVENNSSEAHPEENTDAAGQSEADDDARKIFVGGLNWETKETDLENYFSKYGKVTRCIIKVDRFTGNSRGFGFVTFDNEESVNKVLSVSDHKLMNKRIDPKRAKPSREVIRKIFVGGIDPDLPEETIKEYFSQFGVVENLDLPFDSQKKKRKHYIFVSFTTEAAARKAIAKERQEICGRQCDVRVAVTKEQANKNKNMKCMAFVDPYAAFAAYPYGDYPSAFTSLDPYTYSGYYGCYDYFSATPTPSPAARMYPNYATNSALFRSQYGPTATAAASGPRTNNTSVTHHQSHQIAGGVPAAQNTHFQNNTNNVAASNALVYSNAAASNINSSNSGPHWNPNNNDSNSANASAQGATGVSAYSDYAAQPQ